MQLKKMATKENVKEYFLEWYNNLSRAFRKLAASQDATDKKVDKLAAEVKEKNKLISSLEAENKLIKELSNEEVFSRNMFSKLVKHV